MTEESSSASHLFDATATTEETTITDGSSMTSSSSLGTEFYFHVAVVVIGVIGTAANALILYALVASKQHKKHVLIVNQNALDLYSCIFLVIIHSVKLCHIRLTGWFGYLFCMLILSENILWWGIMGSIINLAIIAIERYLKIVHSAWSNKKLRKWMIYSAMAFSWIGSIVYLVTVVFSTSTLRNGVCYVMVFKNESHKLLYFFWNFVSFYVIILMIFIFCYGRILLVVRRQAMVMAGHAAAGANTSQTQMNQIQTNLIKTMIIVCGFYAVTWLPNHILWLILISSSANPNKSLLGGYYVSVFFAFLYMFANPFIYATKFDPVKQVLLALIPCKKTNVVNTG